MATEFLTHFHDSLRSQTSLGEKKTGKVSPWGKLHKCKLLYLFFSSFVVMLLNYLCVFHYFMVFTFDSKISKAFLPAVRSQLVSRYEGSTPTVAADLLRLQFKFTCMRCETFLIIHVLKASVIVISFINSWRKGLLLLFSSCFSPLKAATCILSDILFFVSAWQQAQSWKNYVTELSRFSAGIFRGESM